MALTTSVAESGAIATREESKASIKGKGELTMLKTAIAIGAATLFLSGSAAMAQRGIAKACAADVKTVCEGVQPGEGRIRDCIKAHVGQLSEPCQEFLAKASAVRAAVKSCRSDVKQFCADVRPGGGRIVACIKTHIAEVSDPCKEALTEAAAGKN
jgi:Cysteine rich repeat